jgi:uncharacterized protein
MSRTRDLTAVEIRVLGALLEKEQTTPDAYPLTVNALLAACNQKTNREPVTSLSESQVWDALESLRHDVLVWRSEGARAERWEHRLDRRWHLTPPRKAVMTLLLLRGPQTPGELRTRGERMVSFDSVEQVEEVLAEMAAGEEPLVAELPRQPGQRESRWAHLVGIERPQQSAPAPAHPPAAAGSPPASSVGQRLDALEAAVAELQQQVAGLQRDRG